MCLGKPLVPIWFWRNAVYHGSDEGVPDYQQAAKIILSRVKEWRKAIDNRLLQSLCSPDSGESVI